MLVACVTCVRHPGRAPGHGAHQASSAPIRTGRIMGVTASSRASHPSPCRCIMACVPMPTRRLGCTAGRHWQYHARSCSSHATPAPVVYACCPVVSRCQGASYGTLRSRGLWGVDRLRSQNAIRHTNGAPVTSHPVRQTTPSAARACATPNFAPAACRHLTVDLDSPPHAIYHARTTQRPWCLCAVDFITRV